MTHRNAREAAQILLSIANLENADASTRINACQALAAIDTSEPEPRPEGYQQSPEEFERLTTCINWLKGTAEGHPPNSEIHLTLMRLAADFEKVIKPRDAQVDAIYSADLSSYRFGVHGGPHMPAQSVLAQAAEVLGAIDAAKEPREPLRSRQHLFEEVVKLVQRRE